MLIVVWRDSHTNIDCRLISPLGYGRFNGNKTEAIVFSMGVLSR
jgi:hypothetical protein